MTDMSAVIAAKSDQINADDLVSGPRTITIRAVSVSPGTEQPVAIKVEGTDKLFRPCKTVSRVLVAAWGADASKYVGRSLTIYRDPDVTWGGVKVGGIRVSAMSHIDRELALALSESKKARKVHKIKPLTTGAPATSDPAEKWTAQFMAKLAGISTLDALASYEAERAVRLEELAAKRPDLRDRVRDAIRARFEELSLEADPTAREGRDDADMGDGFTDDGDDAA